MSYDKDPVVEDVRKVREKIMKEFDYDPHAFGRILAEREEKYRHRRKPVRMAHRRELTVTR
jgi:hypothetical protein